MFVVVLFSLWLVFQNTLGLVGNVAAASNGNVGSGGGVGFTGTYEPKKQPEPPIEESEIQIEQPARKNQWLPQTGMSGENKLISQGMLLLICASGLVWWQQKKLEE